MLELDGALVWAAIEGGGTKFVCALVDERGAILRQMRLQTETPEVVVEKLCAFFAGVQLRGIGLACFGPLELRGNSRARYASLLATPKVGWSGFPLGEALISRLNAPLIAETDVNAAALAEARLGAARGCKNVVYVTVGTGVGFGILVNGVPIHGLLHPELGHLLVRPARDADGRSDGFDGNCPFHGTCLEGLISGPAIAKRFTERGHEVPSELPAEFIALIADYLAQGLFAALLAVAPERIVLGGGVGSVPALLPATRKALRALAAGYYSRPELSEHLESFLVAAALPNAGLLGASLLARALENCHRT